MPEDKSYHIFLCHNSADKAPVRGINNFLIKSGVRTFFDEQEVFAGGNTPDIDEALRDSNGIAIFLGANGLGAYQEYEIQIALDERKKNSNFRIIPVMLPGVKLPFDWGRYEWGAFFKTATNKDFFIFVDFSAGIATEDKREMLKNGILRPSGIEVVKNKISLPSDCISKPGPEVSLFCNRAQQVDSFDGRFPSVKNLPRQPIAVVIPGESTDNPFSLRKRFTTEHLKGWFRQMSTAEQDVAVQCIGNKISWPFNEKGEELQNVLKRRHERDLGISMETGIENHLKQLWDKQVKVVSVEYEFNCEDWNASTSRSVEWMLNDFWKYEASENLPVVFLFFILRYSERNPESTGIFKRLFGGNIAPRTGIEEEMKSLEEKFGSRFLLLNRLKPVRKIDLETWVDRYGKCAGLTIEDVLEDLPALAKDGEARMNEVENYLFRELD